MGFEPTLDRSWRRPEKWRYRRYTGFFAVSFPFFFFGSFCGFAASFEGNKIYDKKMPIVWRIHFRRAFHRNRKAKGQMPSMRKHEELEKWNASDSSWKGSALYLQRLRLSIFRKVTDLNFQALSPFSFQGTFQDLCWRRYFEDLQ